ncbi:MAG: hypothetical protein F4X40_08535 [Chloroflexi bacterium]|nr:hypothetical protein [Chloroflexota bacterium]
MAFAITAHAGDHQRVHDDELKAKECYILQLPKIRMWRHRVHAVAGAWSVPRGNVICVKEVDCRTSRPWYSVLVMKMGTLDRSQHIPEWIDSRGLMEPCVTLSY